MKKLLRSFVVVLAVAISSDLAIGDEPQLLPRELLEEGWLQLFDGQTLYGWQPTGEAAWAVEDGEIRTAGERPGLLMTTSRWADYELHVEFRAAENTNSGVFLRSALPPTDPASDCYELNIAPADNAFPTGSLVERKRIELPQERFPAPDEWHTLRVRVQRDRIVVELNGEHIADYSDPQPIAIGHIGLQSNHGRVAFRNARLRPIGLEPLLETGDLSNFNTERAEECEFQLTEAGELRLLNGPGQLETKDDFANFVMQLECKTNGEGLNSGIFFRTLRTGRWVGYESQIHNLYKDGDRTQPLDFGTGGIYRRQPARRVVADDGTWFTKTIVADGPHMAVWVEGYQVSDWTDPRPPHENARRGTRLGGGAIAIQGHDPTTDLLFRNLQIVELPR